MRIFLGLTEISGYYSNLQKGFTSIGTEATFINIQPNPYQYSDNNDYPLKSVFVYLCKKRDESHFLINKRTFRGFLFLFKIPIFLWALFRFDTFILGFGESFFGLHDLPILKLFRKRVIFSFSGSDSRPPYVCGAQHHPYPDLIAITRKTYNKVKRIEKYADYTIDNPASSHFHSKKFIKGLCIGIPYSSRIELSRSVSSPKATGVKILHSPSDPVAKGSDLFRIAISSLKQNGYDIEYVELIGLPNREVINEILSSDFVIDQVYSDSPMAAFATEAAFFGKPAVVGGYYSECIDRDYSREDIPPSLFVHPDRIYDAIEKMIVDRDFREDLGRKAQEYVKTRWNYHEVAKRYVQIINRDYPEAWLYDPKKARYISGAGLSEQEIIRRIGTMIESGGEKTLCLEDKPVLLELYKKLNSGNND